MDGIQPTKASQAVDFTPGQGLQPANSYGYMDGESMNLRDKR